MSEDMSVAQLSTLSLDVTQRDERGRPEAFIARFIVGCEP